MRLVIDAQLPPALRAVFTEAGHEAEHVRDVGLLGAEDGEIWRYASSCEAVIVSKDEDFAVKRVLYPGGPAVVWLRVGNCTNRALRHWFVPLLETVVARLSAGEKLIELV